MHHLRGTKRPQAVPNLQRKLTETKLLRLTVARRNKAQNFTELVLAVHPVPHVYQMQNREAIESVRPGVLLLLGLQRHEEVRSLRRELRTARISSIPVERSGKVLTKLELEVHRLPRLRSVPQRERSTRLPWQCEHLRGVPTPS